MASHARDVLTDLLTALRVDLGTYDLSTVSSTPKVVIADGVDMALTPPFLALAAPAVEPRYDEANLTEYWVRGTIAWYGCVPFTAETTESRAFAGLDFADEVITAIQTAHRTSSFTTLYLLPVLLPVLDDVFGEGPGVPSGCAVVQGRILYEQMLERGI